MTAASLPETAPVAATRPARAAAAKPDELSLPIDESTLAAASVGAPDWLAADRRAAFDAWAVLPGETNQLYTRYIDLRAARLRDAVVATMAGTERGVAADHGDQADRDALPDDADALIEFHEDRLTTVVLSSEAQAAGVSLTSLADTLAADPDRLRARLEGGASLPGSDKFAQLTRALWSQGVVLDVPAGVRLGKPVVIRWNLDMPDRALLTRTLVHLGTGADVALVEELVGSAPEAATGGQSYFAGTTEIRLDEGATLRVASLQELSASTVTMQHRQAEIGPGATIQWALAQLGGRLVRSRVDNRLVGDRSSVEQVEIVFGGAEQVFDLTSYTTHIGRDTTGDLLSKGALLDRSRSAMKGLITIDKSAIGTDSFLGEFGMNLSKATRSVAIPSLEIDQPDCRRAMHSSSVGPIDENQLFYLESRGIPADEARKFIVLGFLEPVVARVPLTSAQDRLRDALDAKWAAGTAAEAGAAAAAGGAAADHAAA